jgi:hypothetical protein
LLTQGEYKMKKILFITFVCLAGLSLLAAAVVPGVSLAGGFAQLPAGAAKAPLASASLAAVTSGALSGFLQEGPPGNIILGGTHTLSEGEVESEDMVILGGTVRLEPGSRVDGNVLVLGGALQALGEINGDIFGLGGSVAFDDSSLVRGDINMLGGSLVGEEQAQVLGQVNSNVGSSLTFPFIFPSGLRIPNVEVQVNPFLSMLWFLFQIFLWAALAVLVMLFLPKPAGRVTGAVVQQPLVSAGVGLLTGILAVIILPFLAITIICSPIALLAGLALLVAWAFGLIAVGAEVGRRVAEMFKWDWSPAAYTGLGMLLLMLTLDGLRVVVPCIGWIPWFVVGMIGLGAVVLTRFGSRAFPAAPPPVAPIEA